MTDHTKFNPAQKRQLFQFCLYGWLRSLQFFEPFLILILRDKGFSFAAIGGLVAFRAICVNVLEIPSGAMADTWGRRRTMVASMLAYMASFIVFSVAGAYWMFFPAMFFFAIGEAFRTGTHKAIIFHWLTREGRKDEKARVYGLTRSWSKQGSAINCIIAAVVVISTGDYRWVFLLTLAPYLVNLINIWHYPKYLDGEMAGKQKQRLSETLANGLSLAFKKRELRNLIMENLCFEGCFAVTKDFLQPTLKAIAISMPVLLAWSGEVRTAILVAVVYMILNQFSSIASRQSHKAVVAAGNEARLARLLWFVGFGLYLLMGVGFVLGIGAVSVAAFVFLALAFNIWKPVLVSRFYDQADQDSAATTLSIANQGKTLSVAILAPLLGYAVDWAAKRGGTGSIQLNALWPVAAAGCVAAIFGLVMNMRGSREMTS
jgi:MFS family permease